MGVSVRRKDEHFYIFIRHRGERAAHKYASEDEANAVAAAVRHAIALGQFDISQLKARAKKEEQPEPDKPKTLRTYYEETVQPLWDGSLSRNTFKSYDGSF